MTVRVDGGVQDTAALIKVYGISESVCVWGGGYDKPYIEVHIAYLSPFIP